MIKKTFPLIYLFIFFSQLSAIGEILKDETSSGNSGIISDETLLTPFNDTFQIPDGEIIGTNLFHSFQTFNLTRGESPTFTSSSELIANYSLNGNGKDDSSYQNHGVVHGEIKAVENRIGKPNAAYYFDGFNDYIDISTILDDMSQLQGASLSFWMRTSEPVSNSRKTLIQMNPAVLRINPSVLNLSQKGPIATTVELSQADNFMGFEMVIRFDPQQLKALDISCASSFSISIEESIDNVTGTIRIASASMEAFHITDENSVLANISWEVIRSGKSCIEIVDANLSDSMGNSIPFHVFQSCSTDQRKSLIASKKLSEPKVDLAIENKCLVYQSNVVEQEYTCSTNVPLNSSRWNFIVLTIDNNLTQVYMNNEKLITHQNQLNFQDFLDFFTHIYISKPESQKYRGFLDDFKVHDHVLSEEEISSLYFSDTDNDIYISNTEDMQTALGFVSNYNEIYFEDGTYNIGNIQPGTNLRSLSGPDSCTLVGSLLINDGNDILLQGFTIINKNLPITWGNNNAAIEIENASPVISNCIIINSDGDGIYCSNAKPYIVNTVIAKNSGAGINVIDLTQLNVWHSTIVDNYFIGLAIVDSSLTMKNSIVWGHFINIYNYLEYNDYNDINITYSNIQQAHFMNSAESHIDGNNIDLNPEFVDPENNNYQLKANSPCIDSAENLLDSMSIQSLELHYVFNDINNTRRPKPNGSLPDMGAYENPSGKNDLYIIYPPDHPKNIIKNKLLFLFWDSSKEFDLYKISLFRNEIPANDIPTDYKLAFSMPYEPDDHYVAFSASHEPSYSVDQDSYMYENYDYLYENDYYYDPYYFYKNDQDSAIVEEWTKDNFVYLPLDSFENGHYKWTIQGVPGGSIIEGFFEIAHEDPNSIPSNNSEKKFTLPGILFGMILSLEPFHSIKLDEKQVQFQPSKKYSYRYHFYTLNAGGEGRTVEVPDTNIPPICVDIPETFYFMYYTDDTGWRKYSDGDDRWQAPPTCNPE